MTSKQKAAIKKVLIELGNDAYDAGLLVEGRDYFITPYLERIVAIIDKKDSDEG